MMVCVSEALKREGESSKREVKPNWGKREIM